MSGDKKTALDYSRANLFMVPPEAIIIIGLDTGDGPEHELCEPKSNAEPVDDAMVRSIMHNGVIEPVVVRKGADAKHPECVAGRGRTRAAREANRRLHEQGRPTINVPCVLRRGEDGDFVEVIIAENLIRKSIDPMDSARQLKRFLDRGNSNADACRAFGVEPPTIRRWLQLLDLAPDVQARVTSGEISADAALGVIALPKGEQNAAIDAAAQATKEAGRKKVSGTATLKAAQAAQAAKEEPRGDVPAPVGSPTPDKPTRNASARLPPTKGKLREMFKALESGDAINGLNSQGYAMLRWVVTGEGVEDVKGLADLLAGG